MNFRCRLNLNINKWIDWHLERIEAEMANSEDTKIVESGLQKYIKRIRSEYDFAKNKFDDL